MTLFRSAAIALLVLCFVSANAQETPPPIATDRPTVGIIADIVPKGSLQTESGVGLSYSSSSYAANLPQAVLRLGIGRRTEILFAPSNEVYLSQANPGAAKMQATDLVFGVKTGISEPNKVMLQSIAVSSSAPSGGSAETSGKYDPCIILVWAQSLKGGLSLLENVGVLYDTVNGQRQANWMPSFSLSRPLSKKISWFAEYAPTLASDTKALHIVDGGLLYALSNTMQLDMVATWLNDPSGHHNAISLGYSRRIDGFARLFQRPSFGPAH